MEDEGNILDLELIPIPQPYLYEPEKNLNNSSHEMEEAAMPNLVRIIMTPILKLTIR